MKYLNSTKHVMGFLLGNLLIFSLLLFFDLTRKASGSGQAVVGKITFKTKTIQRKFDSQVVWDEVEVSSDLSNKDTIRSAEQSEAVITLKDGTEIQIAENSMILLDFSGKDININFAYGSVQAKRAEGDGKDTKAALNIKTGDQTIKLDETADVKLAKGNEKDSTVSLTVDKGQAVVNQGGKDQVIEKDQKAELSKDKIEIKPILFRLQSPPNLKYFSSTGQGTEISFQWDPLENSQNAKLEVAMNNGFTKSLIRRDGAPGKADIDLSPGIYYWRIAAKNAQTKKMEYSEARKFSIVSESEVSLHTPKNKSSVTYTEKLPIVYFSWSKNELSNGYKVEISSTADFSQIVKNSEPASNSISVDSLQEGTYFWRVTTKPSLTDINPKQSRSFSFSIENKKVIDPPGLMGPESGQKISKAYFSKGKALFIWTDNTELKKYQVQIASDRGFKNTIFSQESVQNFLTIQKQLDVGNYFWRVRGQSLKGDFTQYSSLRSFRVIDEEKLELISPSDKEEFDHTAGTNGILTNWKRMELPGEFVVDLAGDSSFSNILNTKNTSAYSQSFTGLSPGQYFWRVRLIGDDKADVVVSSARSFKILEKIKDPVQLSPSPGEKIDMSERDSIKFTWEKHAKASEYLLEVIQITGSGGKTIYKETFEGTTAVFRDMSKLDEGNFVWNLKAVYTDSRGKKKNTNAVSRDFQITLSKRAQEVKPAEIEVISPKNQYVE